MSKLRILLFETEQGFWDGIRGTANPNTQHTKITQNQNSPQPPGQSAQH